ncbi:helix-turn-helix domain-containing protein [Bdellovibrio sp. NC01]|uniref:helix-turn-helix domain-containing protein n=1 Tax=Bdellovibrio sp. NC01 TaxID=2220073 RepID=UPI0011587A42|nr:helix-turn-helix domain-containing protein [Bdellovibrio sp. NC01]QDK36402.1 hypothetical protein DOE51_01695 [Bdellovibrio sp. NC01]
MSQDLSVKEAAAEINVSAAKVRALIRTGEIAAYRPGKRSYRVTREALETYKALKHSALKLEIRASKDDQASA